MPTSPNTVLRKVLKLYPTGSCPAWAKPNAAESLLHSGQFTTASPAWPSPVQTSLASSASQRVEIANLANILPEPAAQLTLVY